jgi:uncharacterized protein
VPRVVPPVVNRDDEYFWSGVAEDRLLIRRCAECGYLQHPPTPMCPKCGSVEWGVQELSGRGVVYSWIVSRHPTEPEANPRIVAIVELEEGARLVSNLHGIDPKDVTNGMPVEVLLTEVDGVKLPQFRPTTGGQS